MPDEITALFSGPYSAVCFRFPEWRIPMKSSFAIVSAICSWCEKPANQAVEVELDNGIKLDLCWSCLKKKATSAHRTATMEQKVLASQEE
jgi:hypothetical protein